MSLNYLGIYSHNLCIYIHIYTYVCMYIVNLQSSDLKKMKKMSAGIKLEVKMFFQKLQNHIFAMNRCQTH